MEAPRLLGLGAEHVPLKTMAQGLDAAQQMLSRWPSLRTAVVTCMAGYVLVQRTAAPHHRHGGGGGGRPKPAAASAVEANGGGGGDAAGAAGAAGFLRLMLPRRHHPVVEAIGAGDAFVGGFVAASCRQLCAAQALVWAHCTAMLSTQHVGAQDSMPTWGELCDCFEAELGTTITRQQLTVARQPFPAGAATAGGQPAPADAATAPLEPPLAARLPVASPLYLLQTETHLAAARADVPGLVALLQWHPEHVTARGTLSPRPTLRFRAPFRPVALRTPPCGTPHPTLLPHTPHPAAPCIPGARRLRPGAVTARLRVLAAHARAALPRRAPPRARRPPHARRGGRRAAAADGHVCAHQRRPAARAAARAAP